MRLTQKQFVVASLLLDGPAHAYEIEKRIQSEAIRRLVTIGFSSIYQILNKLEERGFVEHSEGIEKGKLIKRFSLTHEGKAVLASTFVSALTAVDIKDEEFLLALSRIAEIPGPALHTLIKERIDNIQNGIESLEQLKARLDPGKTVLIQLGYERRIAIFTGEKTFLRRWLNDRE